MFFDNPPVHPRANRQGGASALAVRSRRQATFAAQKPECKNAKVATVFRAHFVRNSRKTPIENAQQPASKGGLLRLVNGAPRGRTQKQNSLVALLGASRDSLSPLTLSATSCELGI
jgi:hypothetical protein